MAPNMLASGIEPRNTLTDSALPQAPAAPSPGRTPLNTQALLASTIGHAALLSDTPGKWASTIAMLRQNGVDPEHYADFEKGRRAAMAAAGISGPDRETA
jgi:hypothetical protein